MAHDSTKFRMGTTLELTAHRRWIGLLGFALPWVLLWLDNLLPTTHGELESVSAYYYTGGIAVFTGVLFALSGFLISYQGRARDRWDDLVGTVGGVAALVVAILPTRPPPGVEPPTWWSPWMHHAHFGAAGLLFLMLILFCLWLFPRADDDDERELLFEKSGRDLFCRGCGIAMIVFLAWVIVAALMDEIFFLPEALAIGAFALSWLAMSDFPTIVASKTKRAARALKPSAAKSSA